MPVIEALSCGVPVIAPDIGNVDMFPHTEYKNSDVSSALKAIRQYLQKKMKLYNQVKDITWDTWAEKHDQIFRKIIAKGGGDK